MFSNRQLFANEFIPIEKTTDVKRFNHKILDSIYQLSPGTPFFVVLVLLLLLRVKSFGKILKFFQRKIYKDSPSLNRIKACENNDTYFSALIPSIKRKIKREEDFLSSFGMPRLSEEKIEQMIDTQEGKHFILQTSDYNMLAIKLYKNYFEYAHL